MMMKYEKIKKSQSSLQVEDLHYSFVHVAWNNILLDQRKRKERKECKK
jgi:hypothetical protein